MSAHRAHRLLEILQAQLNGVARHFAGHMTSYIQAHSTLTLSNKTTTVLQDLETHAEVINNIDWSGFSFRPGSIPSVDRYLSDPYLVDLLPDNICDRLTEVLLDYHARFLTGDAAWVSPTPHHIHQYYGETMLLYLMCGIALAMLLETDAVKLEKMKKDFDNTYEQHRD